MATAKSFPLVRGRMMRVTKTDGCCGPAYGPDSSVVTEGFVSVALTAAITEPEEITVTNANGKTCVRDAGSPTFQGYGAEITFCEVQPCLFSLITGMPLVTDATGEIIGFKMNSKIALDSSGFALEVWMGVPGVACEAGGGGSGGSGYLLLPCLSGGVIGDFTIENAAITFTVTGAATKDGNAWGTGPYGDMTLNEALDVDDHLYVAFTTAAVPAVTDGCVSLVPPGMTFTVTDETVTLNLPRAAGGCWANEAVVDWGDGTAPETVPGSQSSVTHSYATVGEKTVVVATEDCPEVSLTVIIAVVTP